MPLKAVSWLKHRESLPSKFSPLCSHKTAAAVLQQTDAVVFFYCCMRRKKPDILLNLKPVIGLSVWQCGCLGESTDTPSIMRRCGFGSSCSEWRQNCHRCEAGSISSHWHRHAVQGNAFLDPATSTTERLSNRSPRITATRGRKAGRDAGGACNHCFRLCWLSEGGRVSVWAPRLASCMCLHLCRAPAVFARVNLRAESIHARMSFLSHEVKLDKHADSTDATSSVYCARR